jgi:hypothetical protein
MEDIVKVIIGSPPVLLLCLGLMVTLLSILGRSPLASVPFNSWAQSASDHRSHRFGVSGHRLRATSTRTRAFRYWRDGD